MFPCCFMLIQVVALLGWRTRPRLACSLLFSTTLLIALLSIPNLVSPLANWVEGIGPEFRLNDAELGKRADAIVVLAGARNENAKDYGKDAISATELMRLRYAVELSRVTHLPILITGAAPGGMVPSEAAFMAEELQTSFGVRARWVEEKSLNTMENANFSRKILAAEGIQRIFLVTHAMHLPRARRCFEKVGFKVIGAPMSYVTDEGSEGSLEGWLPSAHGIQVTSEVFHEVIGQLWYSLRGFD
jgi:uncharacterized SAM-binding protein YcdF (DUF218 family)